MAAAASRVTGKSGGLFWIIITCSTMKRQRLDSVYDEIYRDMALLIEAILLAMDYRPGLFLQVPNGIAY